MKIKVQLLLLALLPGFITAQTTTKDSLEISRSISMDTVVVTGRTPQIKNKGNITKIMVTNTVLAKMGDALTMLSHTPGLHDENGKIVVNGYGDPTYVLNGRVLKSSDELGTLQADNIKSIEIDKMPSGEYGAKDQPIIKITTIKYVKDYIFLNIANSMRQTRLFLDNPSLNWRGQFGKVSLGISYTGSFGGSENKETYFRDIYHTDGSVYHVIQQRKSPFYFDTNRLNFALDYNINKNNRIGVYYLFYSRHDKDIPTGTNSIGYDDRLSSTDIFFRTIKDQRLHNISTDYVYSKGGRSLQLTQDVAFNDRNNNGHMKETSDKYLSEYNSLMKTDYTSSSTNAKYAFALPKSVNATVGARFNFVKSTTRSLSDAAFVMDGKYSNYVRLVERNPETFISLAKTFKHFSILPSITYQYVYRCINTRLGEGENERTVQHYSSIIPAIILKYVPNNDWELALNYRNYLTQPGFNDINAGLTFNDSLSYSFGNTAIRATRTNRINLSATWKDLSFSARYIHKHAPIVSVMTPLGDDSNIVTEQSVNFSSYSEINFGLSYSHTFRRLTFSAEADLSLPNGEYTFMEKTHKANRPQFFGQVNMNYRFNKVFYVFLDYTHQGSNVYLTMSQKPVNAFNVGTNVSLLKSRLNMNLLFSDLFGEENYNNVRDSYGNVVNGTFGKNDSRGVTLRMSYTIFDKKVNVKSTNQNKGVLERM